MDLYIGQIIIFGGNFVIQNTSYCDGHLISIQQNTALFSLLGTNYGGNGQTTFGLPELRGRAPINFGQRPGGSYFPQGQAGGTETVTLGVQNLPPHSHTAQVSGNFTVSKANGNAAPASDTHFGAQAGPRPMYTSDTSAGTQGVKGLENASVTVGTTGQGQSLSTMSPYQAVSFLIALQGIYPSRN